MLTAYGEGQIYKTTDNFIREHNKRKGGALLIIKCSAYLDISSVTSCPIGPYLSFCIPSALYSSMAIRPHSPVGPLIR